MSSQAKREQYLRDRTSTAASFCKVHDFKLESLNRGYQLRIEGVLDLYPVNGRWCWLPTGERGDWHNAKDIKKILLKYLPSGGTVGKAVGEGARGEVSVVDGDYKFPESDGTHQVQSYYPDKGEQPIDGIEFTGVNRIDVHNLDLAPSDVPYLRIARNRIHRWWLQRKNRDQKIYTRKEIRGKIVHLNIDQATNTMRRK